MLQVGEPAQTVRVMISTASQQQWVIDYRGCSTGDDVCAEARGDTFTYNTSSTWDMVGLYKLWIEENLGRFGNANYGYDTVSLGYQGEGGPTLKNQTVGALATNAFYFGHFGINPKSTNFTNFTHASPSYMTSLKDQGLIPSVSWGYTAGVPYRFAKVLASLTLGGYDSDRFVANDVVFPFAPDNERDILVSVTGINAVDSSGTQTALLPNPVYSYIDSTIAEIWLPIEACEQFEQAFGLTYDETSNLYLLSQAQHNALLVQNPEITITVAPYTEATGSTGSVDITLPYAAFDQTASPPYQGISNSSRYFPLRRAANSTQYTLGRTFLQEAYLTVDWERQNFSVAACNWANGSPAQQNIVPITSFNNTKSIEGAAGAGSAHKVSPLSTGAIAGIAVGGIVIILLAIFGTLFYLKRKSRHQRLDSEKYPPKTTGSADSASIDEDATGGAAAAVAGANVFPKAELDASEPKRAEAGDYYKPALGASSLNSSSAALVESDSKEREVFEMPGDMPQRQEADGRLFTEKEVMRHREERINGIDPGVSPISPNGSDDRSPTSTLATGTLPSSISSRPLTSQGNGRTMVTPGEIMELGPFENGTMQLVSPLGGSDGSHTMMFGNMTMSPLSPVGGAATNSSNSSGPTDTERKRFSYEDP